MCCSSFESDGKTICRGWIDQSIHSCSGFRVVNAKAVFLMKCYSLWSWLHQMYFQGKAERSLNNKSPQQRKCQEFQTNETANYSELKYETDAFVVILHVCKRKAALWQLLSLVLICRRPTCAASTAWDNAAYVTIYCRHIICQGYWPPACLRS